VEVGRLKQTRRSKLGGKGSRGRVGQLVAFKLMHAGVAGVQHYDVNVITCV
jgi:hypothetical protein